VRQTSRRFDAAAATGQRKNTDGTAELYRAQQIITIQLDL
jgi:hypothetical protein